MYLKDNGFRLYATQVMNFVQLKTENLPSLHRQSVLFPEMLVFTGINHWLKTGQNYLWLTADIKPDRFTQGKTVDFKLMQNSINVSGTLLPAAETNPSGFCTIEESVFFDDFETT